MFGLAWKSWNDAEARGGRRGSRRPVPRRSRGGVPRFSARGVGAGVLIGIWVCASSGCAQQSPLFGGTRTANIMKTEIANLEADNAALRTQTRKMREIVIAKDDELLRERRRNQALARQLRDAEDQLIARGGSPIMRRVGNPGSSSSSSSGSGFGSSTAPDAGEDFDDIPENRLDEEGDSDAGGGGGVLYRGRTGSGSGSSSGSPPGTLRGGGSGSGSGSGSDSGSDRGDSVPRLDSVSRAGGGTTRLASGSVSTSAPAPAPRRSGLGRDVVYPDPPAIRPWLRVSP